MNKGDLKMLGLIMGGISLTGLGLWLAGSGKAGSFAQGIAKKITEGYGDN